MNREIKLRAWLKETKEMIQVYDISWNKEMINTEGAWRFFNEVELMQYVEILDAYEGDLLLGYERDEYGTLLSSWVGVIKYNDEKSRIMILEEEQQDWYEVDDYIFDRIVGNIYENPELLEVAND